MKLRTSDIGKGFKEDERETKDKYKRTSCSEGPPGIRLQEHRRKEARCTLSPPSLGTTGNGRR